MDNEKIIAAGIDYEQGVKRFAGRAVIYEKYLSKFFEEYSMESLKELLDKKDYAHAFAYAHTLKGTAGNLSINAFFEKICQLVNVLRTESPDEEKLDELYIQSLKLYEDAANAVKE